MKEKKRLDCHPDTSSSWSSRWSSSSATESFLPVVTVKAPTNSCRNLGFSVGEVPPSSLSCSPLSSVLVVIMLEEIMPRVEGGLVGVKCVVVVLVVVLGVLVVLIVVAVAVVEVAVLVVVVNVAVVDDEEELSVGLTENPTKGADFWANALFLLCNSSAKINSGDFIFGLFLDESKKVDACEVISVVTVVVLAVVVVLVVVVVLDVVVVVAVVVVLTFVI